MARVLFLSPPRRTDGSCYLFNNATLSLASYLARRGVEARVEPLIGPGWREDLARALDRWQPDLAAISCKWWDTLYGACEVARLVRDLRPACRTVAGGQTATAFARELVERGFFDAVVRGDGERPLLELAQGDPRCNLTWREGAHVREAPLAYVQPRGGSEDLTLLQDLPALADPPFLDSVGLNAPFVWTGKGCQSTCTFCAGSALGHKRLFGRTGYLYRPREQVLADIATLSSWTRNCLMFDFDPVTDPGRRSYYYDLFEHLPQGRLHAALFCWSLPDPEFVSRAAEVFASVLVSVDAQTYSEPLRRRLAARGQLKPFSSDEEIRAILAHCRSHPNVQATVYGIVGLQTETAEDVERAARFSMELQDGFGDVIHPHGVSLTPLSAEPGALLSRNPEKYGMVLLRRTLDDYLEFTRSVFERGESDFTDAPYAEDLPHPYGVHAAGDPPDRVHRDYHRLRDEVRRLAEQRAGERALRALAIREDRVTLDLESRSVFDVAWRLIPWAAREALLRGLPRVEVDSRRAWGRVPRAEVLPLDEQYRWILPVARDLSEALATGRLTLEIRSRPGEDWGFLAQAGATILQ